MSVEKAYIDENKGSIVVNKKVLTTTAEVSNKVHERCGNDWKNVKVQLVFHPPEPNEDNRKPDVYYAYLEALYEALPDQAYKTRYTAEIVDQAKRDGIVLADFDVNRKAKSLYKHIGDGDVAPGESVKDFVEGFLYTDP